MRDNQNQKCSEFLIEAISSRIRRDCLFLNKLDIFNELISNICEIINDEKLFETKKELFRGIYIFGNYILKIKTANIPEKIVYTEEMVETYYRKNYSIKYEGQFLFFGIEIQRYLNGNMCNKEELYDLYASLRAKGYIWVDVSMSNAIKVDDKALIIDLDYIYEENKVDLFNQSLLSKEFEERYQNEN